MKLREWTLHDEIARGGMGIVYRATHDILPGYYAMKVVKPELSADPESRKRFLQEAILAAQLQHPNIVATQTPFDEGGQLFLPMMLLTGETLEAALERRGAHWPLEESIRICVQAAEGLGYAHRREPPVLHRDVKPANIHLGKDGVVRILDFGLAKAIGDQSMTAAGMIVGTPAYVAPEILNGAAATPAVDVYALGVVLFRLLTGQLPMVLPHEPASIMEVVMAVGQAHARGLIPITTLRPDLPAPIASLITFTLSPHPEQRPEDGSAMADALRQAVTDSGMPEVATTNSGKSTISGRGAPNVSPPPPASTYPGPGSPAVSQAMPPPAASTYPGPVDPAYQGGLPPAGSVTGAHALPSAAQLPASAAPVTAPQPGPSYAPAPEPRPKASHPLNRPPPPDPAASPPAAKPATARPTRTLAQMIVLAVVVAVVVFVGFLVTLKATYEDMTFGHCGKPKDFFSDLFLGPGTCCQPGQRWSSQSGCRGLPMACRRGDLKGCTLESYRQFGDLSQKEWIETLWRMCTNNRKACHVLAEELMVHPHAGVKELTLAFEATTKAVTIDKSLESNAHSERIRALGYLRLARMLAPPGTIRVSELRQADHLSQKALEDAQRAKLDLTAFTATRNAVRQRQVTLYGLVSIQQCKARCYIQFRSGEDDSMVRHSGGPSVIKPGTYELDRVCYPYFRFDDKVPPPVYIGDLEIDPDEHLIIDCNSPAIPSVSPEDREGDDTETADPEEGGNQAAVRKAQTPSGIAAVPANSLTSTAAMEKILSPGVSQISTRSVDATTTTTSTSIDTPPTEGDIVDSEQDIKGE